MGGSSGFCAVYLCGNSARKAKLENKVLSFHKFPRDLNLRSKWIAFCKRGGKMNPETSVICSDHFASHDFVRNMQAEIMGYKAKARKLNPNVIPSLNLPTKEKRERELLRKRNQKKIKRKSVHFQDLEDSMPIDPLTLESLEEDSCEDDASQLYPLSPSTLEDFTDPEGEEPNYKDLYEQLLIKHKKLESDYLRCLSDLKTVKNLIVKSLTCKECCESIDKEVVSKKKYVYRKQEIVEQET